jgi:hypothetical protein
VKKSNVENVNSFVVAHDVAFDYIDCSLVECKNDDIDGMAYPHILLAINVVISRIFEKHTIGIRLLNKMRYTKGGIEKIGHVIVVLVIPKL